MGKLVQRISQPQKTAFLGLTSAYLGGYERASVENEQK